MDELRCWYIETLASRIDALSLAIEGLASRDSQALESIRRLAHSVKHTSDAYGFEEIARVSEELHNASIERLPEALKAFMAHVQALKDTGERKIGILVVEDDRVGQLFLREILSATNREVFTASTGKEAEAVLAERSIAIVILAIDMPDIDGRSLLLRLRERSDSAEIPIIVLSARRETAVKTECYALGADAYFEKPCDGPTLCAAVSSKLVRNARLIREAREDALTGLPNRAGFTDDFQRATALATRLKAPLSIAVLDVDNFKAVNDAHGYASGDEVLRQLAAMISKRLRRSDLFARWGSEEFVFLFPNTGDKGALLAMQDLMTGLAGERFIVGGKTIEVSFSVGVVGVKEGATMTETISDAFKSLYLAKIAGKNFVYSPALKEK